MRVHTPGRGLPDELVDLILAEDVLKRADHGRCALVSRSFGKVAHDKLYEHARLTITDVRPDDATSLGDVSATSTDEWRRLGLLSVRSSVRALSVDFIDDDDHFRYANENEVPEPSNVALDRGALARIIADLPILVELNIVWAHYIVARPDLDLGNLERLRSLSMNRFRQSIIASAPNLDQLVLPLYLEEFTPTAPSPRRLRKLTVSGIDSRLDLAALVARLEWLAPPSLEVLEMPLASTSATLLLIWLERHVGREHSLREVKLDGDEAPQWSAADRTALRKLGEQHGFRVLGPGL
ncbi:hypothetical protein JCM9279_004652 [Rhodotorula babjevae]